MHNYYLDIILRVYLIFGQQCTNNFIKDLCSLYLPDRAYKSELIHWLCLIYRGNLRSESTSSYVIIVNCKISSIGLNLDRFFYQNRSTRLNIDIMPIV